MALDRDVLRSYIWRSYDTENSRSSPGSGDTTTSRTCNKRRIEEEQEIEEETWNVRTAKRARSARQAQQVLVAPMSPPTYFFGSELLDQSLPTYIPGSEIFESVSNLPLYDPVTILPPLYNPFILHMTNYCDVCPRERFCNLPDMRVSSVVSQDPFYWTSSRSRIPCFNESPELQEPKSYFCPEEARDETDDEIALVNGFLQTERQDLRTLPRQQHHQYEFDTNDEHYQLPEGMVCITDYQFDDESFAEERLPTDLSEVFERQYCAANQDQI